jgi:hypothetical protein
LFCLLERLEGFMIHSRDGACWASGELWRFVASHSPAAGWGASPLNSGVPISRKDEKGAQAALSREIVKQTGRHSQLCD